MSYSYVPTEDSVELIDNVGVLQDETPKSRVCEKIRRGRYLLVGGTVSVFVGVVILIVVGVLHSQNSSGKEEQHYAGPHQCGKSLFPASNQLCGGIFERSKMLNGSVKCLAYEAYLNCSAIFLCTHGVDWEHCGFKSLHQSLLNSMTGSSNKTGVCDNNSVARFDYLDKSFPRNVLTICLTVDVYKYLLTYACPADPVVFAGYDRENKCMSKFSRMLCLKKIFHDAGLNCTDDIVKVSSPFSDGSSNLKQDCEREFPCVLRELQPTGDVSILNSCVHRVNYFLYLSRFGVDIDHMLAMGSKIEKLKCRVWTVLTMCALMSASVHCQRFVEQVQSALQILANQESAAAGWTKVRVNIFNECPAYSRSVSGCPHKDELVYSTIAYCAYPARKLYHEHGTTEKACKALSQCEHAIKRSYSDCPKIDSHLQENTTRIYLKKITGFDCG